VSTECEFLFQTYAWQDGHDPEHEILRALQELESKRRAMGAREPVQVRLLIGLSLGCARAVERWLFQHWEPDRSRGEAAEQRIRVLGLDPTLVNVEVAYYSSWLFGNFHCKGFIKDQRTVLFTGANVQDSHDYDDPWYEVAVLAEGDIAAVARQDYVDSWSRSYYSWPLARTKPLPPVARSVARGDGSQVPMLYASRLARETFLGATGQNPWSVSLLAAIRNAGTRIRLLYPNLNVSEVRRSLVDAVHRGVRVELVLSKGFNQERLLLPFQEGTNDAVVRDFLMCLQAQPPAKRDGGSLDLRWYSKDGRIPIEGTGKGASHAKYASFDGQVAIVGAGQPDHQSWYHSRENNVVVDCPAATRAWDAKVFEPALRRAIRVR
jgi:phosphatidylserine/phosphatidylglycerophosphate/cardiolipin synthase-like enzyme